jgi:P27 family predicted phage terminase small subunit
MPQRLKTAKEIMLSGNPSNLSKAELERRMTGDGGDGTPTVTAGRPRIPGHIKEDKDALDAWKAASKIMKQRGTLSRGDGELLEQFSVVKARWILACRDIKARGLQILETRHAKDGSEFEVEVPNPSLKVASDCESRMLAYSKTLGLTPMDRSKIKRTKGSKDAERYTPIAGTLGALCPELFDSKGRPKDAN